MSMYQLLPTELKILIFTYAASTLAQVATLELVSKALSNSILFSQSHPQLSLWYHYCTKVLGYTIELVNNNTHVSATSAAVTCDDGFLCSLAQCKLVARENLFSFARRVTAEDAVASLSELSDGHHIDNTGFNCLLCAPSAREVYPSVKIQRFIAKGHTSMINAAPVSIIATLDAVSDPFQKTASQNIFVYDSIASVRFRIQSLDEMESKGGRSSLNLPLLYNDVNREVATKNCYAIIVSLDTNKHLFEESLKRTQVLLKRLQLYKGLFVTPTVVISVESRDNIQEQLEQEPQQEQLEQAIISADEKVKQLAAKFNVPYYAVGKLPLSASLPATTSTNSNCSSTSEEVLHSAISKCCELGAQYTAYAEIATRHLSNTTTGSSKNDDNSYKQQCANDTSFTQYSLQMKAMVTEYMRQYYEKWYPQDYATPSSWCIVQ